MRPGRGKGQKGNFNEQGHNIGGGGGNLLQTLMVRNIRGKGDLAGGEARKKRTTQSPLPGGVKSEAIPGLLGLRLREKD